MADDGDEVIPGGERGSPTTSLHTCQWTTGAGKGRSSCTILSTLLTPIGKMSLHYSYD